MEIQVKLSNGGILPEKAHEDDAGYDLSLINIEKVLCPIDEIMNVCTQIIMYDTGVSVKPPPGYYIEVVPRSSFSKTGLHFVNCVGIIDSGYRGTIKVVLKGNSLNDLSLPYKGFQMILRKFEQATIRQVEDLDNTIRSDGGFGSTDKTE